MRLYVCVGAKNSAEVAAAQAADTAHTATSAEFFAPTQHTQNLATFNLPGYKLTNQNATNQVSLFVIYSN